MEVNRERIADALGVSICAIVFYFMYCNAVLLEQEIIYSVP